MSTIQDIQDEIIAEFNDFDDWLDRYQLLIDLGGEQEPLPDEYKTDNNLIEGCQSRVWLQADYADGKVLFRAESDAMKLELCHFHHILRKNLKIKRDIKQYIQKL